MTTELTLYNLPKVSLNQVYSGIHWQKRKKMKDTYSLIIRNQFKGLFPKNKKYHVEYEYFFKKQPLDASNCLYSAKMIEDVIFQDDKWDIVLSLKVSSKKGKEDSVKITITEVVGNTQTEMF